MSNGDDWFERALRDLEGDEEGVEAGEEPVETDVDPAEASEDPAEIGAEQAETDETPSDADPTGAGWDDLADEEAFDLEPEAARDEEATDEPVNGGESADTAAGDGRSSDVPSDSWGATADSLGEANLPGDEPGEVGEDAPDPFGGDDPEQLDEGDSEQFGESDSSEPIGRTPNSKDAPGTRNGRDTADPFGGDRDAGAGDPFGGGSPRADAADFDPADFQDLGGGAGFGEEEFGDGADDGFGEFGDGESEFDEEEFDSDIDRIDVGIKGLDEMILGGVPERSLMVAIGSAGTGKTTFGLQFLTEALREDGAAVYITLEESREAILSTAEEKGWPFREWCEEDRLAVVALDPIEMANSLASIRSDISRLVTEFGADRLVLDSVSLLEMMYDHPATRRSEVFDFARSLKQAGVTTMLTSEASEDSPYSSRYGIVEYLVDAVFILQYVRPSDFRETRLAVEIQKIRDANHSRETKPYEITNRGISVYRQANIF